MWLSVVTSGLLRVHTAPAPSVVPQFSLPHSLDVQSESEDSEPEHCTLSSQNESLGILICVGAEVAEPSPSCLQTTFASSMSQSSSHTYRHEPEL